VALNRPGIIALACHKRSVGRTTLAAHLAVAFANSGKRVAVSDLDPNTNLAAWWDRRTTEDVRFVELTQTASRKQIQEAARGIELLVIDTPSYPFVTSRTIELADLVLVPAPPAKLDLQSLGPTIDMIKRANRPMVFVMNGSNPGTRDASHAGTALSRYGKLAPVRVAEHWEFAEALTRGLVASELNDGAPCGEEIDWLGEFVLRQLSRVMPSSLATRVAFQPVCDSA
jgi:chromosome partitioning protein